MNSTFFNPEDTSFDELYKACLSATELAKYLTHDTFDIEIKRDIWAMSFKVTEEFIASLPHSKTAKKLKLLLSAIDIVFNDKKLGCNEAILIYHSCLLVTETYYRKQRNNLR
ncbi:hypothetical protein [Vreelandella sedimenti]|uniref:hypothetical protein n=1 Tax=Vreelandella sedimenti TaxID=2729618 RepID=UPI00257F81D8|nr:hypothetical protein [Halomonas sp. UBA3173]|tara:strand:+ start:20145 stop:20480 length:336 start_codon:yes stop_codon:yes gene_type:complete